MKCLYTTKTQQSIAHVDDKKSLMLRCTLLRSGPSRPLRDVINVSGSLRRTRSGLFVQQISPEHRYLWFKEN